MTETLQSHELEANLTESELLGRVAATAADAYKAGVNPIDYFDIQNGIDRSDINRSKINPAMLEVRDKLQKLLSNVVLESGQLAHGNDSRAAAASPEQVLDIATEAFRGSLISARYETFEAGSEENAA